MKRDFDQRGRGWKSHKVTGFLRYKEMRRHKRGVDWGRDEQTRSAKANSQLTDLTQGSDLTQVFHFCFVKWYWRYGERGRFIQGWVALKTKLIKTTIKHVGTAAEI